MFQDLSAPLDFPYAMVLILPWHVRQISPLSWASDGARFKVKWHKRSMKSVQYGYAVAMLLSLLDAIPWRHGVAWSWGTTAEPTCSGTSCAASSTVIAHGGTALLLQQSTWGAACSAQAHQLCVLRSKVCTGRGRQGRRHRTETQLRTPDFCLSLQGCLCIQKEP